MNKKAIIKQKQDLSVKVETKKMPTTPGVPRRSPIQVLTRPDVAYLLRSNGIGSILRGMVVGKSPALFSLQLDRQSLRNWLHTSLCREDAGRWGRRPAVFSVRKVIGEQTVGCSLVHRDSYSSDQQSDQLEKTRKQ